MTSNTLLHRQVSPTWIQSGRVTSQVFKPTPKDNKRISVYDGDQISAENAWMHYTQTVGFESIGILSVTVYECNVQELSVEVDAIPFPEHAVIKFDDYPTSQIAKKAKRLREVALERGWQFQPIIDN